MGSRVMAADNELAKLSFREEAALFACRCVSTAALSLLLPLSPLLARYSRRVRDGYDDFLGNLNAHPGPRPVWVHGVSMGESMVAMGLIRELKKRFAQLEIVFTTTHPDVFASVKKSGLVRDVAYFPLDNPLAMRRAFMRWRPAAVLVVETDFWPEFSWNCRKLGIPLILVNGRISEKLASFYSRFRSLGSLIFNSYRLMLVQGQADHERLVRCGAMSGAVKVLGNMKADLTACPAKIDDAFMPRWLSGRQCLIFGSLHPVEFAELRPFIAELSQKYAVLIAPRNPANAVAWQHELEQAGVRVALRSNGPGAGSNVMVLDTMGELAAVYGYATAAFVGGSLNAGVGGHNPLEVICHRVPLIMGCDYRNFADIVGRLKECGGIKSAVDSKEVTRAFGEILSDSQAAKKQAASAFAVLTANLGVVDKTIAALEEFLPLEKPY